MRELDREARGRAQRTRGLECQRRRGSFAVVLGRPVAPAVVPPDNRAAVLANAGIPAEVATELLGMYDALAAGRIAPEGKGTERRRGTVPLVAGSNGS